MLTVEVELPPARHAATAFIECARQVPLGAARISRRRTFQGELCEIEVQQDPHNYLHLVRCLAETNRYLRTTRTFAPLYASGVVYAYRERPGRVSLRSLHQLYPSKHGDCGELVAARASEDPSLGIHLFKAGTTTTGGRLYHVVCRRPDGELEDPSLVLATPRHNPYRYAS